MTKYPDDADILDDDDDRLPTTDQAQQLAARIGTMTPTVKASDERDIRQKRTAKRRAEGEGLTIAEVRDDLEEVLDALLAHITLYKARKNRFLETPADVLAYAERAAWHAMQDYPRDAFPDATIRALWDTFDKIHTGPRAWRIGEYPHDAAPAIVESIRQIAHDARLGRYPAGDHDDTPPAQRGLWNE